MSESPVPQRSGPAVAGRPRSVGEALGGPLGVAESVLPPVAFVTVYTLSGEAGTSAWIALGIGTLMAGGRIIRGQTIQYALAGLIGVGLAAFIVSRTGRAEDFFLPGLLANAAYALGCGISIAVRRPLVGLVLGSLRGEGTAWRRHPARVRAYSRATWIWVGAFSLRLAVQLPLYLTGAVVALGAARVAMGIPIFLVALWLSWLLVRDVEAERGEGADPGLANSRARPQASMRS